MYGLSELWFAERYSTFIRPRKYAGGRHGAGFADGTRFGLNRCHGVGLYQGAGGDERIARLFGCLNRSHYGIELAATLHQVRDENGERPVVRSVGIRRPDREC